MLCLILVNNKIYVIIINGNVNVGKLNGLSNVVVFSCIIIVNNIFKKVEI